MSDRRETGRNILKEVIGDAYFEAREKSTNWFNAPIRQFSEENCFGDLWTRPGLDRKTRSLLLIGMLTALNRTAEVKLHVRSTIRYGTGLEHILLLLSTPIDDVTSYFTFVVWRNDDFSVSAEEIIRFDLAIGAEDKRMLELLDGVLPLDQTTLVSVQADKCAVEWRRRLADYMGLR